MTDLIWIGNSIYPRWVVFAAIGIVIVTFATIGTIIDYRAEKRK